MSAPDNILKINIPDIATKQLQLQNCSAGRKLVISTNWLPLFGFETGCSVREISLGKNKGLKIVLEAQNSANLCSDMPKPKKVYSRAYKVRKNNPLETMLDIRSQKLLNEVFPEDTQKVHILFKFGEIIITPITNRQSQAISDFKHNKTNKFSTFLACSSGVDAVSLKKTGFEIETLLEFRPHEKRDKNDLSETGALNALANIGVKHLINEDIMALDIDKIAKLTQASKHTLFHISTQCDDFSNVKASSLKECSLEDGSTSIDMIIDALDLIKKFNFPTILHENVRGFESSDAGRIFKARLKRLGYRVYDGLFDAREHGGNTGRVRHYLFATQLPSKFSLPQPVTEKPQQASSNIWERYIEPRILSGELRDVTDLKTTQDGIATGRARLIKRDSSYSPTFLKSQNRQAKDSVFVYDEIRDKYYFPSNSLMAELMGIPDVCFDAVSSMIEGEIIGQSIEAPLHEALLEAVRTHIQEAAIVVTGKLCY
ncbi:MAG: DNA cytosine methyltransferase [Campylobacterales bacterium]|nr:DNA cytosine methyltransferase [Campylobacterales bacterium]